MSVSTLALATVSVDILQYGLNVPNPSAVYLVAVVATAIVSGTAGAIGTAVASFVLYDFLFTEPRFTMAMNQPGVWLSVVLLLFVGIVVGQLAALQRSRAAMAELRERQARALFAVSRRLVTRPSVEAVLSQIATAIETDAAMSRVWITLDGGGMPARAPAGFGTRLVNQLQRSSDDAAPHWTRLHDAAGRSAPGRGEQIFRVVIESAGRPIGSIWSLRDRSTGLPNSEQTQLLAASADLLGQAIAYDRLAAEARTADLARQSDALKSSLLQSVSHDLRTPLATIRAAAGSLGSGRLSHDERQASIGAIEREVEYLNQLVGNLLDLSRIEAGVLHGESDVFELDDLIESVLDRLAGRLGGRQIRVSPAARAVRVDSVFFAAALTNLIENVVRHTPRDAPLEVSAAAHDGMVRLTVEDGGPGVAPELLQRIFEKFYRVPDHLTSGRSGTGIGLAVVRGLVQAMGGEVSARASHLGGLAIDIDLPAAELPLELTAGGARS